jgi:hypothetical protein
MCVFHKRKEVRQMIRRRKEDKDMQDSEHEKDKEDSEHMPNSGQREHAQAPKPQANHKQHKHTRTSTGGTGGGSKTSRRGGGAQRQAHQHNNMPIMSTGTCQTIRGQKNRRTWMLSGASRISPRALGLISEESMRNFTRMPRCSGHVQRGECECGGVVMRVTHVE